MYFPHKTRRSRADHRLVRRFGVSLCPSLFSRIMKGGGGGTLEDLGFPDDPWPTPGQGVVVGGEFW